MKWTTRLRQQKGRNTGYVRLDGRKIYLKGKYPEDGPDKVLAATYSHWVYHSRHGGTRRTAAGQ